MTVNLFPDRKRPAFFFNRQVRVFLLRHPLYTDVRKVGLPAFPGNCHPRLIQYGSLARTIELDKTILNAARLLFASNGTAALADAPR